MDKVDVTIIGAGAVGLAVSHRFSELGKKILVVEKNRSFGQETSSRNSEVIHAGLYYPPSSLKSQLCLRGKHLLYELCKKNGIPHKQTGKILVACTDDDVKKLQSIYQNALFAGINNLRFLTPAEMHILEPDVQARTAFFSPDTGIIDSHGLMSFLYDSSKGKGVDFAFGVELTGIKKVKGGYRLMVKEPDGDAFSFETSILINSAGLNSGAIAKMAGIDTKLHSYEIKLSKGQYFRIKNPKKFRITHLVYPAPSKVDLGIHITLDLAGGIRLGPDSKYVSKINYDVNDADKEKFFDSVSRFLPGISMDDIIPDTAGMRPKLQGPKDPFTDFVIENESEKGFPNLINLIGIESPGLTACLAIAEKVDELIKWDQIST